MEHKPVDKSSPEHKRLVEDHERRIQWWRKAKFGMFIHYGAYSSCEGLDADGNRVGHGNAEWIQEKTGEDTPTYAARALKNFKVTPTAPEDWAELAKQAGCEYVVLTTKHHEGFLLFGSKLETEYSTKALIDRDIVKEYVKACRDRGLKVGLYHSVIDWHHPQYDPKLAEGLPFPAKEAERVKDEKRDHSKYQDYLHYQVLNELLENYGEIDIIWFDFSSPEFEGQQAWRADDLMKKIREKCPNILINNRLYRRREAGLRDKKDDSMAIQEPEFGDFLTPEQRLPKSGGMTADWESCMTLNANWGYSRYDDEWKSPKQVVEMLSDCTSKAGNLLLNIGPKPDGSIPQESIDIFQNVGEWMKTNSEAIKNTREIASKGTPEWLRISGKENVMYLLVFSDKPKGDKLNFETDAKVIKATVLGQPEAKVDFKPTDAGFSVDISNGVTLDPRATVVKVELDKQIESVSITTSN